MPGWPRAASRKAKSQADRPFLARFEASVRREAKTDRDEAAAKNIIKTDDKMKVVEENDNIIIQSTNPEKVYVPRYEPEMLYAPNYPPEPIAYYPDPYPNYYYPTAPYFAAATAPSGATSR